LHCLMLFASLHSFEYLAVHGLELVWGCGAAFACMHLKLCIVVCKQAVPAWGILRFACAWQRQTI